MVLAQIYIALHNQAVAQFKNKNLSEVSQVKPEGHTPGDYSH